jgi:hypothetical protein
LNICLSSFVPADIRLYLMAGLISSDEGAVISAIQGFETDVRVVKNIIYGLFTNDASDADQPEIS